MKFDGVNELSQNGFQGFKSVASLQASDCREIPPEPGVYLVLRPDRTPPEFLSHSIGGHFKGKDPSVAEEILRRNWVDNTVVVYIGKAGQGHGRATLRSRLLQYMQFGQGKPVGHWGGRYIWQLVGSDQLLVCWKVTTDELPSVVETRLIKEFTAIYGKCPFANLRR